MGSSAFKPCIDDSEPLISMDEAPDHGFSDMASLTEVGDVQTQSAVDDRPQTSSSSALVIVPNGASECCTDDIDSCHESHLGHQIIDVEKGDEEFGMNQPNNYNGAFKQASPDALKTAPPPKDSLSDADDVGYRCNNKTSPYRKIVDTKASSLMGMIDVPGVLSPPMQPQGAKYINPELLPPRSSPLHVQIQEYALRWGHWAAMIENKERREEVLRWVTSQMRYAWEMAIRERYYSNTFDSLQDTGAAMSAKARLGRDNIKRAKKKVSSPAKEPVGFAYEGKDMYAVTNGELENAGITIEMINQRIESRDLGEAELLLDEVLTNLNRNIGVRDWSVNPNAPVVPGRNLLMFCLYAAQESRSNIDRLEELYNQFTRDIQKRNTQKRIDLHQQRVDQHLALAAELNLRQKTAMEPEHDSSEEPQLSLVLSHLQQDRNCSESRCDIQEHVADQNHQDRYHQINNGDRNLMIKIAKDVLNAGNQSTLQMAFQSHGVGESNFEEGIPTDFGNDQDLAHLKKILGNIFRHIMWIVAMRQHSQRQEDPKEKIKIGHDVQLSKAKIEKSRGLLREALNQVLSKKYWEQHRTNKSTLQDSLEFLQPRQAFLATNPNDVAEEYPIDDRDLMASPEMLQTTSQITDKRSRQETDDHGLPEAKRTKTEDDHRSTSPSATKHTETQIVNDEDDQSMTVGDVSKASYEGNHIQNPRPFIQQASDPEAAAKQVYTDEVWLPKINQLLQRARQPSLQGVLNKWKGIKDVLTRLGYSLDARNKFLRAFKDGFKVWSEQHGDNRHNLDSSTSVGGKHSQRPWPEKDEVIALVGKQGIMAQLLLNFYSDQCEGQEKEFLGWVKSFTRYDSEKRMFYPLGDMSILEWQNDVVNAQTSSKDNNAPGLRETQDMKCSEDFPSSSPSLKLHAPKHHRDGFIVKLKAGQAHDFGEYSSHLPNISKKQGFAFRFTPYATMKQRERLDELISDYATNITKELDRRRRPYGEYVQFVDPEDPDGGEVAHGFWNLKNGDMPKGSEWFYDGKAKPEGWDVHVYENSAQLAAYVDDRNANSQHHQRRTKSTTSKRSNKPSTGNKKAHATNVGKTKNRRVIDEPGEDTDSDYDPLA